MRKKIFTSMWIVLLFISMLSVPMYRANAEEVGIKISPVKFEELVKPGEVLTRSIKVTNDSNVAKTFYADLNDFVADGEEGKALLMPAGTEPTGISSWIDITKEGVEFAPHEEKQINFTINVPVDAGAGGYYGAVLFGTEAQKLKIDSEDKGAAMATSQKTASLFLLQVAGTVEESARIREFLTSKTFYSTPFDVEFITRIENQGTTHIKPIGAINIKNFLGKDVAVVRVNENNSNVLRKSIRKFDGNWKDKLAFGKYTASLGLSFGTSANQGGQGKQSLYSETTFWIFPWKIIIPTVLGFAIFISVIVLFLKLYKDRAVRRAMEQIGARQRTIKASSKTNSGGLGLAFIVVVVLVILLVIYIAFFA